MTTKAWLLSLAYDINASFMLCFRYAVLTKEGSILFTTANLWYKFVGFCYAREKIKIKYQSNHIKPQDSACETQYRKQNHLDKVIYIITHKIHI